MGPTCKGRDGRNDECEGQERGRREGRGPSSKARGEGRGGLARQT